MATIDVVGYGADGRESFKFTGTVVAWVSMYPRYNCWQHVERLGNHEPTCEMNIR